MIDRSNEMDTFLSSILILDAAGVYDQDFCPKAGANLDDDYMPGKTGSARVVCVVVDGLLVTVLGTVEESVSSPGRYAQTTYLHLSRYYGVNPVWVGAEEIKIMMILEYIYATDSLSVTHDGEGRCWDEFRKLSRPVGPTLLDGYEIFSWDDPRTNIWEYLGNVTCRHPNLGVTISYMGSAPEKPGVLTDLLITWIKSAPESFWEGRRVNPWLYYVPSIFGVTDKNELINMSDSWESGDDERQVTPEEAATGSVRRGYREASQPHGDRDGGDANPRRTHRAVDGLRASRPLVQQLLSVVDPISAAALEKGIIDRPLGWQRGTCAGKPFVESILYFCPIRKWTWILRSTIIEVPFGYMNDLQYRTMWLMSTVPGPLVV